MTNILHSALSLPKCFKFSNERLNELYFNVYILHSASGGYRNRLTSAPSLTVLSTAYRYIRRSNILCYGSYGGYMSSGLSTNRVIAFRGPFNCWICLVEPVFHIPWDFFSFFPYILKNEDFSVKIFYIYYSNF